MFASCSVFTRMCAAWILEPISFPQNSLFLLLLLQFFDDLLDLFRILFYLIRLCWFFFFCSTLEHILDKLFFAGHILFWLFVCHALISAVSLYIFFLQF